MALQWNQSSKRIANPLVKHLNSCVITKPLKPEIICEELSLEKRQFLCQSLMTEISLIIGFRDKNREK